MATTSLRCPHCESVLRMANPPAAGKKIKCPRCATIFAPADHIVTDMATAVKPTTDKPARPVPALRPAQPPQADEEADKPRSRQQHDSEDEERPRRGQARRRRDGDDDEDYEEERPRRKRKKKQQSNVGLIIGVCAGGGVLLLAAVITLAVFLWPSPPAPVAANAPVVMPVNVPPQPQQPQPQQPQPQPQQPQPQPQPQQPRPQPQQPQRPQPPVVAPQPQQPQPQQPAPVAGPVDLRADVLQKVTRATAFIRVDVGNQAATGSGFLVKAGGDTAYVVTNFHVIAVEEKQPQPQPQRRVPFRFRHGPFRPAPQQPKAKPRITVVLNSGTPTEQTAPAEVVAFDEEADLAALRITGVRNLPAALDANQPATVAETQPVYIFGFPMNKALPQKGYPTITVGKGTIAGLRWDANHQLDDIHINGDLNPGNSGGPVVDAEGHLVGIAVATVAGKQIGFAVPVDELKQMFKGRLFAALVFQMQDQPGRINVIGETWAHDRNNNVRGRDTVTAQLPGEAKPLNIPKDVYLVYARLSDPLLKVQAAHMYFARSEDMPTKPTAQGWAKLANAAEVALKIQDQTAVGEFKLPPGAVPDETFAFQFSYINADGQTIFTQPHPVRLTFPKNPQSVTVRITSIPNVATVRYLADSLPGKLTGGQVSVKGKTRDSLELEINPVPDPKTVLSQLTFGQIKSVQGRIITMTVGKIDLPLPNPAGVAKALEVLKSPDLRQRKAAAEMLAKSYIPLPERRVEVAKALEEQALGKDFWLSKAATNALRIWGGPENVPGLCKALESGQHRHEILAVLMQLNDPASAEAIAKLLPGLGDRAAASAALKAMGPKAERAVIPFLTHKDGFTVREACGILKEIGTAESIPALTALARANNAFISPAAQEAIAAIRSR